MAATATTRQGGAAAPFGPPGGVPRAFGGRAPGTAGHAGGAEPPLRRHPAIRDRGVEIRPAALPRARALTAPAPPSERDPPGPRERAPLPQVGRQLRGGGRLGDACAGV